MHPIFVLKNGCDSGVRVDGEKPAAEGEKPGITHRIVSIGFGLCILLALNFNRDRFLCVFFWVHNG
jgi:hypothetical protein